MDGQIKISFMLYRRAGVGMYYATLGSEDNLWELVLSFHLVGPEDCQTRSPLPAKPSYQPERTPLNSENGFFSFYIGSLPPYVCVMAPGTGVMNSCELHRGSWDLYLGPLEVLLTAEQSLEP